LNKHFAEIGFKAVAEIYHVELYAQRNPFDRFLLVAAQKCEDAITGAVQIGNRFHEDWFIRYLDDAPRVPLNWQNRTRCRYAEASPFNQKICRAIYDRYRAVSVGG
jgi:hypothetical protein